MTFLVQSSFSYNLILVLDCLRSNQMQTARRLHDDLLHYATGVESAHLVYKKISTKSELFKTFREIGENCLDCGHRPILHLEFHGDKDRGILIGESNEWVSWKELNYYFVNINVILKNDLIVCMAGCFGAHVFSEISPVEPSPYFLIIGPDDEISNGDLLNQLPEFYKTLIATNNIKDAISRLTPAFVKAFTVQFFYEIMLGYYKEQLVGKGRQGHIERMITIGLSDKIIHNRADIRKFRVFLRQQIRPTEDYLKKYGDIFLHGKYEINFHEFMKLVRSSNLPQ